MAILKVVSSYLTHVDLYTARVSTDDMPSLDHRDLAALREHSRDEPPSPPPQPPPSPSGWTRPSSESDPSIVSMGLVGPCATSFLSPTNLPKGLHPHIRVTLFPSSLTTVGIPRRLYSARQPCCLIFFNHRCQSRCAFFLYVVLTMQRSFPGSSTRRSLSVKKHHHHLLLLYVLVTMYHCIGVVGVESCRPGQALRVSFLVGN